MLTRPLTLQNDINRNKNLSSLVSDFEALRNTLYTTPSPKSQMLSERMSESRNNIKRNYNLWIFDPLQCWCQWVEGNMEARWMSHRVEPENIRSDAFRWWHNSCQRMKWMSSRLEHQALVVNSKPWKPARERQFLTSVTMWTKWTSIQKLQQQ